MFHRHAKYNAVYKYIKKRRSILNQNTMEDCSPSAVLYELRNAFEEAIASGSRYRTEHNGFDFAVYTSRIKPLLQRAKSMCEYEKDPSFKHSIDSFEKKCDKELMKARWRK